MVQAVVDGSGGVEWGFHANGFIIDDDDTFLVGSVRCSMHKLPYKTPRGPVKNCMSAGSGVVSVPMSLHPHPSPTRESILMHEKG